MAEPKHILEARRAASYETDFAAWALEQANLLREGRFAELDVHNLAEEVESVGKSEFRAFVSAIELVILHMMKWDYQPELRSRSWRSSIHTQRRAAVRLLKENPSFKPRIEEAVADAFAAVPGEIERQTTIPAQRLPERCPYSWDEIMTRLHDFDPDAPWPN